MFRYIWAWLQALFGYLKVWPPDAHDSAWFGAAPPMEEEPVTVSLGPIGPLFQQLRSVIAALQGNSDRLKLKGVKAQIQILGQELEWLCIDLKGRSETPADAITMCWMKQVRDLCYDTADYLDELVHFIHCSSGTHRRRIRVRLFGGNNRPVGSKTFRISGKLTWLSLPKVKKLKRAPLIAKLSALAARVGDADERRKRFKLSSHTPSKPDYGQAAVVMPKITTPELHIDKLNKLLDLDGNEMEKNLKVVTIFGSAGVDKTALARTLYHQHGGRFQHRAFIRVTRDPDMRRLLTDMLSQIKAPPANEFSNVRELIVHITKHLQGKSYLIIIDDLWTTSTWDIIFRALPDDDYCRIITTTQIEDVALACCSYQLKHIYEIITPLNDNQSGKSEGGCTTYPSSEGMKKDLNLAYNNLTPCLKTCLLYLNMYTEGYTVWKDELVKQWLAEGFIGSVQGQGIEETAGYYFDALISSGLVQSVDTNHNGKVLSCTLHHMVLDLIRQKSMEENFVTIVNYFQTILGLSDKVRRLSVQLGGAKGANHIPENMRISQVRSLLFSGYFKCVPSILDYGLLQVLILHIWSDQDKIFDVTTIGELYRLRYMKIDSNMTVKLPGKIRRLRHLGTLQVDARLSAVPSDIVHLEKLLHLRLLSESILPHGVGHMTSLLTLAYFDLGSNSEDNVRGLGELENLQDLQLTCSTVQPAAILGRNMQLLGSVLHKPSSLQSVTLAPASGSCKGNTPSDYSVVSSMSISCDGFSSAAPPLSLQRLELSRHCCIFSRLPKWFGELAQLCNLKIAVRELSKEDIDILKALSALTALSLHVATRSAEMIVFGEGGFSGLTYFKFTCTVPWLKFLAGAMPNIQKLRLGFNATRVDRQGIIIEHLSGIKEISAIIGSVDVGAESTWQKAITNDSRNPKVQWMGWPFHGVQGTGNMVPKPITNEPRNPTLAPPTTPPQQENAPLLINGVDVATGAMNPLINKLGRLLMDEYNLEKRVRKGVKSLMTELEIMHVVLCKIGDKPPEQLDAQVLIWAGKVRDLSYNMEDAVDAFIVRLEDDYDHGFTNMKNRVKKFLRKTTKLVTKGKALHQISDAIEEAHELAKELGELRQRYMLEAHANSNGDAIDPRLKAVYRDVTELVGIDHTRDELIKKLCDGNERSKDQLRTMSIVGFGGLGKTTLAKAVYDKIKVQFDSVAFVSVSRNPDMAKIFKKVLYKLDKRKYATINEAARDNEQLIDELRLFLQDKRYLIVIDDIWDEKAWKLIKCAFTDHYLGSRVMTTTRIGSISKVCCSSGDDIIYQMKPLPDDESERLFDKRIFPQGSKCPDALREVYRKILKKCGGVPLAIITIASILAINGQDQHIKPKYHWDYILGSIGRGLAEGDSAKDMQRILSFSYYDLPSHLKTCLLYLSIFPEDFEIRRDRLIWMWIAEGFVQGGKQGTTLFELGESYFNELANRNLIQPVDVDATGKAAACRVHDMVLDLLCSLSSEQNFTTLLDGTQQSKPISHSKSRRLSFQNSMSQPTTNLVEATSMPQVRSVVLFRTDIDLIQSISCFQALRVLDLEGCEFARDRHHIDLRYIENLLHLRYLGLRGTFVRELPEEIGKLQFLETLDLAENGSSVETIPSSIVRLKRLIFLDVQNAELPVGIENLTSLEELKGLLVDVKELGQLVELRVLFLYWTGKDESVCNSLVESLGKLPKMQSLTIYGVGSARSDASWDGWVPNPQLRYLWFTGCTTTLPRWVNSSLFPLLSFINIEVERVQPKVDIQILGMFPALRVLQLWANRSQYARVETFVASAVVGANAFPCLRECIFYGFLTVPSMFPRGAMPRLEILRFHARASDIASGQLDVGMGNLPSLRKVQVFFWLEEGSSSDKCKEEAVVVLRHAVDTHPNRPTLFTTPIYPQ